MRAGTSNCVKRLSFSAGSPTRGGNVRNAPIELLLTYYGDDFTGSTDVLEALARGGVEAVLFVAPPNGTMLQRYAHVRAFGVAGDSRTMSPDEMEQALPEIFRMLRSHEPQIVHYKICSTFDSSPEIGSIGRAIDIGHRVYQNRVHPLVVGAPSLRRFCVFGNLFAQSGLNSAPFRLDRSPSMQCHPVTPMNEADLRVHLSRQTSRPIELVDVLTLDEGFDAARNRLSQLQSPGATVLFDTLTDEHLETIGRLICDVQLQEQKPLFVVGSSGIDYALVKHWQSVRMSASALRAASYSPVPAVDRTIVVSGSCSPVTDRQIGWALEHGFAEVAVDPSKLYQSKQRGAHVGKLAKQIVTAYDAGNSVIAHTCRGPAGARIASSNQRNGAPGQIDRQLGVCLGRILGEVLRARRVQRVAIAGGDTSGQVARALGIEAVEVIGPLEPGAPLCVARSPDGDVDGLEIAFKGGQVGYDDFFGTLRSGQSRHATVGAST
jgi:uncharacterized protein YgbK (DUF1537 family)